MAFGDYIRRQREGRDMTLTELARRVIQRLNELYAEINQVGFIGRLETDGAPVLQEAFARVKLALSSRRSTTLRLPSPARQA